MEGEKFQNLAFADYLSTHIFRPQASFSIPNVLLGDTPLLMLNRYSEQLRHRMSFDVEGEREHSC